MEELQRIDNKWHLRVSAIISGTTAFFLPFLMIAKFFPDFFGTSLGYWYNVEDVFANIKFFRYALLEYFLIISAVIFIMKALHRKADLLRFCTIYILSAIGMLIIYGIFFILTLFFGAGSGV